MMKNKHGIVRIKPGDILGGKDGLDWSRTLLFTGRDSGDETWTLVTDDKRPA